ncbi:DUF4397 domain-containing protein [Microbacterium schleiferi]|uniref:DUF4397 domain-containing protein n=1 Tax=Microbacterium schleiferi TaxID=69362 RepID=A0A7S8RG65_9MICO|nr:DUF4397 domain-containing protein [Microbacterium schleiferi]QPE03631.1 DUF4397 domain-containing protein [Microbacterium schleiferi]
MRKTLLAGATAGALLAFGAVTPALAISDTSADLSVLHGIPDTPVDVYVNGELTIDDFQPGDLAGPLDLPAGDYEVALTAPDAADASSPVLGPITLTLAANTSYTAVAHLTEAGDPTATLFTNDISETAAGEGRLTVRHVAAAPAVDILAGDTAVVEGLANPDEATLDLAAGTVSASVVAAGTTSPALLGPADVTIADGQLTIVYAWGSLDDDNLALAVQTIDGLYSAPGGVNSGTGGQLAQQDAMMQGGLLIGGLVAAAVLAGGGVLIARSVARR